MEHYKKIVINHENKALLVFVKIYFSHDEFIYDNNYDFQINVNDLRFYKLPILHLFKLTYNLNYDDDKEYKQYTIEHKNKLANYIYKLIVNYDYKNMNDGYNYN